MRNTKFTLIFCCRHASLNKRSGVVLSRCLKYICYDGKGVVQEMWIAHGILADDGYVSATGPTDCI